MLREFAANGTVAGLDVTLVVAIIGVIGVIIGAVITARATIKAAKLHRVSEEHKTDLPPIKIVSETTKSGSRPIKATRTALDSPTSPGQAATGATPSTIGNSESLDSIETKRLYEGLSGDQLDAAFISDVMINDLRTGDRFEVDDFREGDQ